ncbi:MAG: hypothetical protein KatS3mg131_1138 [Candidatus Tectimicrobiota bacterium]|nr:MAG: hypothetical protein KatS3mg131_1138 [Candidatus Tectomicrobia bacterium]
MFPPVPTSASSCPRSRPEARRLASWSLLCAGLLLLLAACAGPWRLRLSRDADLAALLRDYQQLQALPAAQLQARYEEEAARYAAHGDNALRLSLLLLLPDAPFRDPARALTLLRAYGEQAPEGAGKHFAALLGQLVGDGQKNAVLYQTVRAQLEAVRLEKQALERTCQQLHAEAKASQAARQQCRKQLQQERQLVENLQKMIDELKHIEKRLHERKRPQMPAT